MYKIIMEGITEKNNILMIDNITDYKKAVELQKQYKKEDYRHSYVVVKY